MDGYELEVKEALKMTEKEKKVFYLDLKCYKIVNESETLKKLCGLFLFEGIFKPKIENEKSY